MEYILYSGLLERVRSFDLRLNMEANFPSMKGQLFLEKSHALTLCV